MMEASTLSMAARGLRLHLEHKTELPAADIGFGHPASTLFSGTESPTFSIYFYKVFSAGNNSDDHPGRPLDVKAHCVLTPLSKKSANGDNGISPGEKDLRILGQVMACMHKHPRFDLVDEQDEPVCEVEIIPVDLSTEELNKIVPSPPEGGFRSTVAYELALFPIALDIPSTDGPVVDIITYSVSPDADPSKPMPMAETVTLTQERIEKPVFDEPWKPHLYIIDDRGYPAYARHVATDQERVEVRFLVAGPATATDEEQSSLELLKITWSPFSHKNESKEIKKEIIKETTIVNAVNPAMDYSGQGFPVWLETRFSCQYLFRLRRTPTGAADNKTKIEGNACLVTVACKGVA
ncbi:MAG: DUF4255 domain-containing protein [Desulfatitalea sp.]|nr:DUF4255 domain-containing protein [Desulfatitalea sp.]NNK02471.1 DUF4255 domain-containing protein [Desulfatitalea sp.]